MKIEIMFVTTAKVAGHRAPAVVTFDDGPLVRGLLKGGHAVLIDPPHLPGYNDDELPEAQEEVLPEPVVEEPVIEAPTHHVPMDEPVIYVPSVTLWPKEPVPDKQEAVKENQEKKPTKRKYVRSKDNNEGIYK